VSHDEAGADCRSFTATQLSIRFERLLERPFGGGHRMLLEELLDFGFPVAGQKAPTELRSP